MYRWMMVAVWLGGWTGQALAEERKVDGRNGQVVSSREERVQAIQQWGALKTPEARDRLLVTLRDPDNGLRMVAIKQLEGMLDMNEVVTGLLPLLRDSSANVRQAAAVALGPSSDPRVVKALSETVKDAQPLVGWKAIVGLGESQEVSSIPALTAALADSNVGIRIAAAQALEKFPRLEAVPALLVALNDSNSVVRKHAGGTLNRLSGPEVEAGWGKMLQTCPHEDMRERAAEYLGRLEKGSALKTLLTSWKSQSAKVRGKIGEALGGKGDPEALPALREALMDGEKVVRLMTIRQMRRSSVPRLSLWAEIMEGNPYDEIRYEAVMGLGVMRDPEAVDLLARAAGTSKWKDVRQASVTMLGPMDRPEAVKAMRQAVDHSEESVRFSAVRALGQSPRAEAREALGELLHHPEWPIRWHAAKILTDLEHQEASLLLKQALLHNEYPEVRQQAMVALVVRKESPDPGMLEPASRDQDPWVKWQAGELMGENLGGGEGLNPGKKKWQPGKMDPEAEGGKEGAMIHQFVEALRAGPPERTLRAALGLATLDKKNIKQYPEVIPALKLFLPKRYTSPYLSEAARQALEQVGGIRTREEEREFMKKALVP